MFKYERKMKLESFTNLMIQLLDSSYLFQAEWKKME